MSHQTFNACIEACNACVVACNHCAASCLQEQDVKMMVRCIALDMDCAQICALASAAMARGSEHARAICALCADICQSCGDECAKHNNGALPTMRQSLPSVRKRMPPDVCHGLNVGADVKLLQAAENR